MNLKHNTVSLSAVWFAMSLFASSALAQPSGSVTSQVARLEVDPVFTKITSGTIVNDAGTWVACAWGDSDNDGFIDLFITSAADANESLQRNAFYHNNGNGTFTRITTDATVSEAGNWRGAAWADYDNDGHLDLFVTRVDGDGFLDQTALYHNNGNGSFTKMGSSILGNAVSGGFSKGCVWGDYDNDGFVDMFVARNSGTPWLLQNNGDGTLTMLTNDDVGIAPDNQESQFAMWGDYDDDGWPDVFVTDLVVDSQFLYHNNRDGSFTGSVVTEAPGGGAWVDYDNDGNLDLIVGNSVVYHNKGDGTFTKETSLQVGSVWGDYDNDGFIDSFDGDFLYHNNGDGTFTRVSGTTLENDQGNKIAAAWGDYDNDGFLDLFVTRGGSTNLLYRNNGNSNSWIKFKLVGTVSNRSAIGAKVRVKATLGGRTFWQMREINTGDGFDVSPLGAHFGLGNATNIDLVRIEWPSGIVQTLTDVSPKQFLTVVEHQENAAEPVTLTATERSSDGAIKLSVSGKPGLRYLFEGSTNLVNWTKIGVATNVTGAVEFLDSKAANFNWRFYRASAP